MEDNKISVMKCVVDDLDQIHTNLVSLGGVLQLAMRAEPRADDTPENITADYKCTFEMIISCFNKNCHQLEEVMQMISSQIE